MFKTFIGVTENSTSTVYLRPETAQGIFVNFKNVCRTTRRKIPFGIGQVGKSFRNEITPGNFIFRIREFEQMELEFFCKPGTDLEWFEYWKNFCKQWLLDLGLEGKKIFVCVTTTRKNFASTRKPPPISRLSSPSAGENCGALPTAPTTTSHDTRTVSGETLDYTDPVTGERYIPYVIEPSLGADRAFLAFWQTPTTRKLWEKATPCGTAPAPRTCPRQSMRVAAFQETRREGYGNLPRPHQGIYLRIRRGGKYRKEIPPSGRNRHALLRDCGL